MRSVDHGTKTSPTHVSVVLGRAKIGVPEEFLDGPQVGAAVEQVGGETVAQCMRVGRGGSPTVDDAPHVTWREAATSLVVEQGGRVGLAGAETCPGRVRSTASDDRLRVR